MGRFFTVAIILLMALASTLLVGEARPKFPPDETMNMPSLTLTDEQFLRGDSANGVAVMLTGQLRFPNWNERLPAVVLLHGSGGVGGGATWLWEGTLNDMGVATLRLDSFSGRGLTDVGSDQDRLGFFTQIYDVYRAVEALAGHPRIDPSRIAVMGFSRGGTAALYSSMSRFQDLYGPQGTRIAGHLPFYPACNFQLVDELDVTKSPIREFHGAADDWTLAAPCRDYMDRLAAAGHDAEMVEYPGARHSFDNPQAPALNVRTEEQTSRNCRRHEVGGRLVNTDTGQPFTYRDPCVEYGPTVQYDSAATEAAKGAVKKFLTGVFRLN
jgi:dienelactone hydrolase